MSDETEIKKLQEIIKEIHKILNKGNSFMGIMIVTYIFSSIAYVRGAIDLPFFNYVLFAMIVYMSIVFINGLFTKLYVIKKKKEIDIYDIIEIGASLTFKKAKQLEKINSKLSNIDKKILKKLELEDISGYEDIQKFKIMINGQNFIK